MFIFRTRLVNTEIVNILSTNVIQFYCVTGVVSSFRFDYDTDVFQNKIDISAFTVNICSSTQAQHWMQSSHQKESVSLTSTAFCAIIKNFNCHN